MSKGVLITVLAVILLSGCSSNISNPIAPSDDGYALASLPVTAEDSSNRMLLGMWDLAINSLTSEVHVIPSRNSSAHFNVTSFLPAPTFVIKSYDPLTKIYTLDITINNNTSFTAYDVRLIFFITDRSIKLVNPDDWTSLYDIAGGWSINPFKAFAKLNANRKFANNSQNTETVQLSLPDSSPLLTIAIDASFPGNCNEPYEISNFTQDPLYYEADSETDVTVDVFDWQNNTNSVSLYCPSITGVTSAPFTRKYVNRWVLRLVNATGARPGNYLGCIIAGSVDSGSLMLYDVVTINVNDKPIPTNPRVITNLSTYGSYAVDVSDGFAYFGDDTNLVIADVSDPENPNILGQEGLQFDLMSIVSDNFHAFMGSGRFWGTPDGSFEIADVQDPYLPEVIGSCSMVYPNDLDVSNDLACVADGAAGLKVVDISDKNNPYVAGTLELGDKVQSVVFEDFIAFTAYGTFYHTVGGVAIVNVSDPANPQVVQSGAITGIPTDMAIKDSYALITTEGTSIQSMNLITMAVVNTFDTTHYLTTGIDIQGDYAYIVHSDGFLTILDVSDPTSMKLVSELDTEGDCRRIDVEGRYAYIANSYKGLTIVKLW